MNSIINIKNLSKKYKNFELKDINLSIPAGTIVGLVGENGAGKTTLIKLILNLIKSDGGQITIFNKDNQSEEKLIKEDLGVALDDSFFYNNLKIDDINKIMHLIYKNWDEKLFYDYVSRFNLPKDKIIKQFSLGTKKKLEIVTALSHHPKLLILDEPTSGLDPIIRNEILEIFMDFIQDEDKSVLLSTHITSDLENIADYIFFISNGSMVFYEEKDELINKYGILKCGLEDFDAIEKKNIIRYHKHNYGYDILITDKNKYSKYVIDRPTIDSIMYLYIKGAK